MAVASLGVIASASGTGTTLVLPVTVNVPRSDPSSGATIVLVYVQTLNVTPGAITPSFFGDDAPMDSFYNTCYYSDGLNHYGPLGTGGPSGSNQYNTFATTSTISPGYAAQGCYGGAIMFNPLVGGVNSIIITFPTATDFCQAYAVAYTGCQQTNVRSQDTPPFLWHTTSAAGGFWAPALQTSTGLHSASQAYWCYSEEIGGGSFPGIGPPWLVVPGPSPSSPVPYPDYEWDSPGTLLIYMLGDCNHGSSWGAFNPVTGPVPGAGDFETTSGGGWTWGNGSIGTVFEVDDAGTAGFAMSMVYAEQTVGSTPLLSDDLTGSWASMLNTYTFGGAAFLSPGGGPPQCVTPPPASNYPVFNSRYRAGSLASSDGAPIDA